MKTFVKLYYGFYTVAAQAYVRFVLFFIVCSRNWSRKNGWPSVLDYIVNLIALTVEDRTQNRSVSARV